MIQRIQTLWLLVASALAVATLFIPLALFSDGADELTMRAFALVNGEGETVQPMLWLGILLSVSALLPFITVFLFRRRLLQIRLCVVEMVLLAGSLVMMAIYIWILMSTVSDLEFGIGCVQFGVVLPLVAIIFVAMAARAIFRDELLVRSLDRIR